jgi:hypothetical protein
MPVSAASIGVGKFYRRFGELCEVVAIDSNGDVTFRAHGNSESGESTMAFQYGMGREKFAGQVDREASPDEGRPSTESAEK